MLGFRFWAAFTARDLAALREIVSEEVRVELVGGNEMHGAADSESFFAHAFARLPGEMGVPANPRPYRSPTLEEFQALLARRSEPTGSGRSR